MDDNSNTNSYIPPVTPAPAPLLEKKKTGKKVLMVLLVILLLVAAAAGGYFYSQMNKNTEIEAAKADATAAAVKENSADLKKATDDAKKNSAQTKTNTETTCNADELSLVVEPSASGGAGTIVYTLTFANIGKRTCILGGFPGVSLVNSNGNMVGTPADRATNYTEKKLTLEPNAKVKAEMATANTSNFPEGKCKSGATKIRVYPPNDAGYLSVTSPIDSWCPNLKISPILPL